MLKPVSNDHINYHFGVLHFAHLLVTVDGVLDHRERQMMESICQEEGISEEEYKNFISSISNKKEREVYEDGLRFLKNCTHEEKIAAMVYLLKLLEADESIHRKELKLLFYSLEMMGVDFEDVELAARMSGSK